MAYRFTNTDKWNDSWFSELSQFEKLFFIYLCDNCDIAGFIELNYKRFCSDLNTSKEDILGALQGLNRGLIISESMDCLFIRNYLKHQKNLPLNEKNNAHLGIIKRFELYKNKFKIENIENFMNQEVKPLVRGYGNGKGNDNGKGNGKNTDFNFKKSLLDLGVDKIVVDTFLEVRKKKKLTNSEIAFNKIKTEITKSGLMPNEALTIACEKSWGGFESEWLNKQTQTQSTPSRRTTNEIFDKVKEDILNGQLEIKPII